MFCPRSADSHSLRCLRAYDRAHNEWPALHLPEVYLLEGGYKRFFCEFPELCEPRAYTLMLDPQHRDSMDAALKERDRRRRWGRRSKSMSAVCTPRCLLLPH